eukprot:CAMPEP_0172562728 /NCGR_PEP_ID=MMETSP1067-20121228/98240_1 /TAXON_ID=265564 ORGANISM="Thalassiosira punctigera, Strain Tpunct2005C2" /NCGR_SAMPLE_ID=MMETSP1067 /ASSEMBLY_ACC=CAM_ASM_000444 /LENGTH=61 /DNA_ID=CAMNT_0013353019 /DNA_START=63 /DNA_END=248 /DNA_ORIENTATION=+
MSALSSARSSCLVSSLVRPASFPCWSYCSPQQTAAVGIIGVFPDIGSFQIVVRGRVDKTVS